MRKHWLRCRIAVVGVTALAGCKGESPTSLTLGPVMPISCFCDGPPSASGQIAVVGQPVAITLEVTDQHSNPASGVRISWAVVHDGGFTDVATSVTDSSGNATVNWTLDTIAKLDSLQASLSSGAAMLVTATGRHAAAVPATKISGDAQTVAAGATSQPFVVKVTDRYGNAVSMPVAWAVTGGGTLSAITTTTDANGATQVTLTTGAVPGVYRIVATYGAIPASTFTLTAM